MDEKIKEVTITIKEPELFQLHLCIKNRIGFVTQEWCNAMSQDTYKEKSDIIAYLTDLDNRLMNYMPKEEK